MLTSLRRLYRHMEWADAITWRTVLANDALAADAYILDSLHHLHLVQRAHLSVWTGEKPVTPTRGELGGPREIRDWGRAYHALASAFLESVPEARLNEPVPLPDAWITMIEAEIGGPLAPATLGDVILQVATHSIHHRAQVGRRIRELGSAPGVVDWIGWVWRGEPAPDWSG